MMMMMTGLGGRPNIPNLFFVLELHSLPSRLKLMIDYGTFCAEVEDGESPTLFSSSSSSSSKMYVCMYVCSVHAQCLDDESRYGSR